MTSIKTKIAVLVGVLLTSFVSFSVSLFAEPAKVGNNEANRPGVFNENLFNRNVDQQDKRKAIEDLISVANRFGAKERDGGEVDIFDLVLAARDIGDLREYDADGNLVAYVELKGIPPWGLENDHTAVRVIEHRNIKRDPQGRIIYEETDEWGRGIAVGARFGFAPVSSKIWTQYLADDKKLVHEEAQGPVWNTVIDRLVALDPVGKPVSEINHNRTDGVVNIDSFNVQLFENGKEKDHRKATDEEIAKLTNAVEANPA